MEQSTWIKKEQIPLEKLEKVGIKRDFMGQMESQELKDFLNGFRSQKLYTVNARINDEDFRIPAKIRLQKQEDGSVNVRIHPIQRLQIPEEYMGYKFSKEDKSALLGDKNLGKTVELTGKNGQKDQYFLSIDSKTNELVPLRTKHIDIPEKIKGVSLSDEQKQKLGNGEKVTVENMTGSNGKKFSAVLQVDAASRSIGFSGFKQEMEKALDQKEEKKKGAKQKVA
jgi:hypothetical protein